jgi:hypothetical protein
VVEASWYGAGTVSVPSAGPSTASGSRLVASQVGRLPPARAPRWTHARRLSAALALLAEDPATEALISGETRLRRLARGLWDILAAPGTLCHRIRY